ncbi:hypothetical protein TBLA_0J00920 [Henningerozyma blattae CBS 6284]|uniref:Enhancer of translation termination 1 n=1 Tax=Henningerozyma blattae (strain ATCC 34711 / CBS 6284 / DSM 70876 / NBRC 10599 / NRRL Y-10934 / UCD 77-7) TaxID=1071380 RepID=I2H9N8_HENB6|nr:hypothetical protein TBLA_0J00920 [Tetrapisispora blattae CBS 6284]CCH63090.1 hypothetical protein TBLA_0J00920 [Tetrapisispora blattae CBS 6284]
MAKRALGLGKGNNNKKQKTTSDPKEPSPEAQLNFIVDSNIDDSKLDDELIQLNTMWKNFFHNSDRDDEILLNAIIHECDNLLRSSLKDDALAKKINSDQFHAIYSLALSELANFKTDSEKKNEIGDFFDDAIERIENAKKLEQFQNSVLLPLTISKIHFHRIPLQYISDLNLDSTSKDLPKDVDLNSLLENGKKNFKIYKDDHHLTFEVLSLLHDLLDIVETFNYRDQINEGLDSDDEDFIDDLKKTKLSENHPLFTIQKNLDENYDWLLENLIELHNQISESSKLFQNVSKIIGELYLKKSEKPASIYLQLQYDDEDDESNDDDKDEEVVLKNQKSAIDLIGNGIKFLKHAKLEDDPDTWVAIGEGLINLGNLQDLDSEEQQQSYKEAEELIRSANKATNGKFKNVLENLLSKDDE